MTFSVRQIAEWSGGRVANAAELGEALERIQVDRPAELAGSTSSNVAYFFSKAYQSELLKAAPGVLITGEPFVAPLAASGLPLWKKTAVIACADPYLAMAILSERFAEALGSLSFAPTRNEGPAEVHPSAVVHSTAELGAGVQVGPNAVIEAGAKVGEGTRIGPGCWIGPRVTLGAGCVLFPSVTIYEWTEIGSRVRIHSGTVIGADGFGYAPERQGAQVSGHRKIYHLGRVVIGDDVEIGANSCIDRGTIGVTRVGNQAKIDNLVQVGHNCVVEEGAILCGKAGLSGRARVGRFAYVGGASGLVNDIEVGPGAMVGGMTLVTKDVPAGAKVVGNPHREASEHFRVQAMMNKLLRQKREGRKREDE